MSKPIVEAETRLHDVLNLLLLIVPRGCVFYRPTPQSSEKVDGSSGRSLTGSRVGLFV